MFTKLLDVNKIAKVYSGKRGCMCGCQGKYSYTQDGADNHGPGYNVQDSVSERSVKIMAKKVFNNPNTNWDESQEYCYVEDKEKNTIKIVYFKK
jgi:hypothetical protein